MVSIRWEGFGGLASACKSILSSDSSHFDPNGLANPLDMEILEL